MSDARGFTLVEVLIAILILIAAAALAAVQISSGGQEERFIQLAARRVRERRTAALRLNPLAAPTSLEPTSETPLTIDFSNLGTTAALALEGSADASITHVDGSGNWVYVYQGLPVELPAGWELVTSPSALTPIPPISRSSLATQVSFASDGTPSPKPPLSPSGEAPFWAIYFRDSAGDEARAIGIHETGLVEVWRWDGVRQTWQGFGGRQ